MNLHPIQMVDYMVSRQHDAHTQAEADRLVAGVAMVSTRPAARRLLGDVISTWREAFRRPRSFRGAAGGVAVVVMDDNTVTAASSATAPVSLR